MNAMELKMFKRLIKLVYISTKFLTASSLIISTSSTWGIVPINTSFQKTTSPNRKFNSAEQIFYPLSSLKDCQMRSTLHK